MKPLEIFYEDFDSPNTKIVIANASDAITTLSKIPSIINQGENNIEENLLEIKNTLFILEGAISCIKRFIKINNEGIETPDLLTGYFFVLSRLLKDQIGIKSRNPIFDITQISDVFLFNLNDREKLEEVLNKALSFKMQISGILFSYSINPNKSVFVDNLFEFIHRELDFNSKKPENIKVFFNLKTSDFYIGSTPIYIDPNSNQDELLRLFFKNESNAKKEWFYDEIGEEIGQSQTDARRKAYYNCMYQLNRKIKEAGIKDFFSALTMHKVKINDKYLA